MASPAKNTICLWFNGDAEKAARLYASTFPDSFVGAVYHAPGDFPSRYWNAIVGNGGEESACGWCKDKWGVSWQITPAALTRAIAHPDPAAARRAFEAMMEMTKIDISAIEAAIRG
jgi:2-polyprenyl-6-hydroxyphenyl methylase/3-demethylubiquinone-9 3-methyltransferase